MDSDVRSLLMSLAARSGSNINPVMQMILAQNGMNPEDTSSIDPQDLLSRLKEKDPTLALIAQQLLQPKKDQEIIGDYSIEGDEEVQDESNKLDESFHKLSHKVEIMQNELEQLREINKFCAAALGACSHCWGSDPNCKACAGTGQSGAFMPNREYFAELVVPALRRVRRSLSRNHQRKKNQYPPSDNVVSPGSSDKVR